MEGTVIWIAGIPGSGKSTLADAVKKTHPEFFVLRMDDLRKIATPKPTYSEPEREIIYNCLVFTAKTLSRLGHDVLIDATANKRSWRELARKLMPVFAEVYLTCPIPVCKEREHGRVDTKSAPAGIYEKADKGWPVPGVNVQYEESPSPELRLDTSKMTVEEELIETLELIRKLKEKYAP